MKCNIFDSIMYYLQFSLLNSLQVHVTGVTFSGAVLALIIVAILLSYLYQVLIIHDVMNIIKPTLLTISKTSED